MNNQTAQLLEQHFDTAFAAPDGIKKLRDLILTLAMQGKLVAQDPNDPPARELLKEIEAEKQRMVKEGKIKAPKPLPEIKPEEMPYALPVGWEWSTLAEVSLINPRNSVEESTEVAFVPMTLIGTGNDGTHKQESRIWSDVKSGFTHFAEGDIGVAKITPCFENSKACIFSKLKNGVGAGTTELHIIRPLGKSLAPRYVLAYLKSPQFLLVGQTKMTGTAGQKRLPKDYVESNRFPLPPIAEQHRIVVKIDQLMARCDELEKLRTEREQKRLAIHTAALRQLLDAQEQDSSADAWQFLTRHFSELYSVKENVAELRNAILQLAVMGKLVPQNSNDPPASELLKEIEMEKQRLVKKGKIKKPKLLPEITLEEVPFQLPKKWLWIRVSSIAETIDYGTSQKAGDDSSLVPVYRMGNIVDGKLVDHGFKYIAQSIGDLPRLYLKNNDILFNRTNSYELVGKSAIYTGPDEHATFASYLIRIRLFEEQLLPAFFSFAMNSTYFRSTQIEPEIVQQCGQANFNGTKLSSCLVPLPPLSEQHRIVAKIDQLMALCNTLEQQIDEVTGKQTDLLNAIMAQV